MERAGDSENFGVISALLVTEYLPTYHRVGFDGIDILSEFLFLQFALWTVHRRNR